MKLRAYRWLTQFFKWLSKSAERGVERFDYCEACGERKYTSRGCVGRALTYKAVQS